MNLVIFVHFHRFDIHVSSLYLVEDDWNPKSTKGKTKLPPTNKLQKLHLWRINMLFANEYNDYNIFCFQTLWYVSKLYQRNFSRWLWNSVRSWRRISANMFIVDNRFVAKGGKKCLRKTMKELTIVEVLKRRKKERTNIFCFQTVMVCFQTLSEKFFTLIVKQREVLKKNLRRYVHSWQQVCSQRR